MSFYMYILQCSDDSYYVGHTDNLEQRFAMHVDGTMPCYTLSRRPVALVYSSEFGTREEALAAERQLKGWSRAKKKALIKGDFEELKKLAQSHGSTGSP